MMLRLARSCVTRPAFVSSFRWNDSVLGGIAEAFGHRARRQSGAARDHQGPEHLQANRLGQRGQRADDVFLFHDSTIVE